METNEFKCPACHSVLEDNGDGTMECPRDKTRYYEFMGRLKRIDMQFTNH